MSSLKVKENRLRRKAHRLGLELVKSRRRDVDAHDFGLFAILDNGILVHPAGPIGIFDLVLEDVEDFLTKNPEWYYWSDHKTDKG